MSFLDLFRYKRKCKFEKISLEQFISDFKECIPKEKQKEILLSMGIEAVNDAVVNTLMITKIWENIQTPYRKTEEAMGHDFIPPFKFSLAPGESLTVPTGIKVKLKRGYGCLLSVRSGCGKYRIQLDDTIPAIDGDYYGCVRNDGHIIITLTNDNRNGMTVNFAEDTSFIQAFIVPYAVDVNDWKIKKQKRLGGFGSTSKHQDKIAVNK